LNKFQKEVFEVDFDISDDGGGEKDKMVVGLQKYYYILGLQGECSIG